MSAFGDLADEPRWVAWRNEKRGDKLTKVPHGRSGRAKANDPTTWVTLTEASVIAERIVNGLGGGIGIELGNLGFDVHLAGIDLDSCIDEKQCLAPWAKQILVELDTYAETSPSGTGVKSFFYIPSEFARPFLELIGVTDPAQWGVKRSVGQNGANHGPGVEIYFSHRFFAVTEHLFPGRPARIATLSWEQLERLAALIPKLTGGTEAASRTASGCDASRSAKAFREGAKFRREGKSLEEMCNRLRTHPDYEIRDWVREKGEPNGNRELHRIWDKAAPAAGTAIVVEPGKRHIASDQGIAALIDANVPFYQRDRKIQRVALVKAKNTSGEIMMVPGIVTVDAAMPGRALGRAATWQRFDMRRKQYVRIDPPSAVIAQILGMVGD